MTLSSEAGSATRYSRAWTFWALGVCLTFTTLEVAALRDPAEGCTLSEQLRRRRHVSGLAIAVGATWLVHHIVWRE